MDVSTAGLVALAGWLIRIAAVIVVPLKRAPAAARGWLLLILFEPFIGLPLYLMIGRPTFPASRRRRFLSLSHLYDLPARGPDTETTRFARALGAWPATAGNRVTMHADYDDSITRLIADIDAAERSVDLLAYIFASDRVGERVAAALRRAGARGVACRVLFDPVGAARWRKRTQALLRDSGAQYRQALPLRILKGFTRRDLRNHRKLYMIDGRIGWIGSQNIVAPDFRPGIVNRELIVRAEGPLATQMQCQFEVDWHMESQEPAPPPPAPQPDAGEAVAQLLPSGPDYPVEGFQSLLVWQLHRAQRRAIIVTPYFIPDADLFAAMRSAVLRGVDVHLLVSRVMDQPLVGMAQRSFYADMLAIGVHIHRFPRYLLHAKNVSIDEDLAIVGSSNVDLRSFQLNLELSLLLLDRPSVFQVIAIQQKWLAESELLNAAEWAQRPLPLRVAENIARLFDSLI